MNSREAGVCAFGQIQCLKPKILVGESEKVCKRPEK
jgi:hypothetical protein